MKRLTKKLFITGGHFTPALAVIEEIKLKGYPIEIVFIGRINAMEGSHDPAQEERIIHVSKIRFLALTTGRFQRTLTIHTFISLLKIPIGFIQALYYCVSERPDAVLSFGGYIALPIALVSAFLGIPVITHEQTAVPGAGNRVIGIVAKKICVTFDSTSHIFPPEKTVVTGLPVRSDMFLLQSQPSWVKDTIKCPIVYVTGGSTGSASLNALIFPLISRLTEKYFVIHQIGRVSFDQAIPINQKNYVLKDYFEIDEVAWIFQHAALIVGRSGANTVMEIAMLGKIGLFVPLPWAGGDEQMQNARWLETHGSALILPQEEASSERLMNDITKVFSSLDERSTRAKNFSVTLPRDGAKKLIDEVVRLL